MKVRFGIIDNEVKLLEWVDISEYTATTRPIDGKLTHKGLWTLWNYGVYSSEHFVRVYWVDTDIMPINYSTKYIGKDESEYIRIAITISHRDKLITDMMGREEMMHEIRKNYPILSTWSKKILEKQNITEYVIYSIKDTDDYDYIHRLYSLIIYVKDNTINIKREELLNELIYGK